MENIEKKFKKQLCLFLENTTVVKTPFTVAAAESSAAAIACVLPCGRNLSYVLFLQIPSEVSVV